MDGNKDDEFETSHWLTTTDATLWTLCDSAALSDLDVSSPVDDVSSRRSDVDGVQDGPQYLAKRSGDERINRLCVSLFFSGVTRVFFRSFHLRNLICNGSAVNFGVMIV